MAKDPKPDYYATLGVNPSAEDIVIRAAFKALAQRYHPDRFSGSKEDAHRRMSDLTGAYEVLADPIRRRKHDRHRHLYARIASFHGKDPSIGKRLGSAVANHVSVAVGQRHYRVALIALMVSVVVLSTFNIYQYSDRLKQWLRASPTVPVAESKIQGAPAAPAPLAHGTLLAGDPPEKPAANVNRPPIGPGGTRTGGTDASADQTLTSRQSAAAMTSDAQLRSKVEKSQARPPATDMHRTIAPPAPAGAANPRRETKPPGAKPAAAKSTPARRPDDAPPAVAVSELCSDVAAALGLCDRSSTGKKR
jgi:curved DNA-binding protein CbpA